MIPVNIRTYKNSFLASLISLIGSLADALCKLLGLALIAGMISEAGLVLGVIAGFILLVAAVCVGALIQRVFFALADKVASVRV